MNAMIAQSALLICSLFLAGQSYRLGERQAQTSAFVMALAAAFIAAASLGTLFLTSTGQDQQTLLRILNNLAFYAALPLLGSALVSQAWQWEWSRAAWGRWLLALFALFELLRRAELGELYSQVLVCVCLLGCAVGLLRQSGLTLRLCGCLILLALTPSLLLFSPGSLKPALASANLYALSLAAALLLLTLYQSLRAKHLSQPH